MEKKISLTFFLIVEIFFIVLQFKSYICLAVGNIFRCSLWIKDKIFNESVIKNTFSVMRWYVINIS